MMKILSRVIWLLLLLPACGTSLPKEAEEVDVEAQIYPDYRNVVIPANVAPLNFRVEQPLNGCVVRVSARNGEEILVEADGKGDVRFPLKKWKSFMVNHADDSLSVDLYVKDKSWMHYNSFSWVVKPDSIDPIMTCRLIEPSYRGHGALSLVSYNLEDNTSRVIAENEKLRHEPFPVNRQSCLNCHSQQRNGSGNSLFFYRGEHGGLVLTYNGKSRIINSRVGDMYASTTYPAWHPYLPLIAFSINAVGQTYPVSDPSKTEVIDDRSDMVLYDIEKDEISYITKTKNRLETFPCWSADGKFLYFAYSDSAALTTSVYQRLRYDLARISFDADSLSWGEPQVLTDFAKRALSANYPQPSPDGRFMLFAVSRYGCSPYRHADCDIYVMDMEQGTYRLVHEVDTPNASDYCRGWSRNGHWILISSRKDDGNYGRVYFSYCDETGHFSKPFQLPHEYPAHDLEFLKSYNAPEFAQVEPIMTPSEFYHLLDTSHVQPANYRGTMDIPVDANSGASVIR